MSQPQTGMAEGQTDKSRDAPAKTWEHAAALLIGGPNGQIIGDKSLVPHDIKCEQGCHSVPWHAADEIT